MTKEEKKKISQKEATKKLLDKRKIQLAENAGYKVKIIWEMDWSKCENKIKYLRSVS